MRCWRTERTSPRWISGDELGFPGSLFLSHFNRARDAGWHITVHAGEAAGPEVSGRRFANWGPNVSDMA